MIQCWMPNEQVVQALLASGYVCRPLNEAFHYETNAPLEENVPFDCGGVTLLLASGKVFPSVRNEGDWWVVQYKKGVMTGKKAGPYTREIANMIACSLNSPLSDEESDHRVQKFPMEDQGEPRE